MNKYNYLDAMINDIKNWINNESLDLSQFEDMSEAREYLDDNLWEEDSVTGNGAYGYASEEVCEEYLCHNLDILLESLCELEVSFDPFQLRSYIDHHRVARFLDCTIRCYLLAEAIDRVLEELNNEK